MCRSEGLTLILLAARLAESFEAVLLRRRTTAELMTENIEKEKEKVIEKEKEKEKATTLNPNASEASGTFRAFMFLS